jgi:hypothetical protein
MGARKIVEILFPLLGQVSPLPESSFRPMVVSCSQEATDRSPRRLLYGDI